LPLILAVTQLDLATLVNANQNSQAKTILYEYVGYQ